MRKLNFYLCIALCISLIICLISCKRSIYAMEQDVKRESAYENGYNEGYNEGRWEGIEDAKFYTEDDLSRLSWEIEDKYGICPENAINLLTNYADGEPVSEKDIMNAIWALHKFYWGAYDIINNMEDYYSN